MKWCWCFGGGEGEKGDVDQDGNQQENTVNILLLGDENSDSDLVITSILSQYQGGQYFKQSQKVNQKLREQLNYDNLKNTPICNRIKLQRYQWQLDDKQSEIHMDERRKKWNIIYNTLNLDFEEYYALAKRDKIIEEIPHNITLLCYSSSLKDSYNTTQQIQNIIKTIKEQKIETQIIIILTKNYAANYDKISIFNDLCKQLRLKDTPILYPDGQFHENFQKQLRRCLEDKTHNSTLSLNQVSIFSDQNEGEVLKLKYDDNLDNYILQKLLNKEYPKEVKIEEYRRSENLFKVNYLGSDLMVKYYFSYYDVMKEESINHQALLFKEGLLLQKIQNLYYKEKKEKKSNFRCCKIQSIFMRSENLDKTRGYSCIFFKMPFYKDSLYDYIECNKATINDKLRYKWCIQILRTIIILRENNIFHIDLKPQNIFLTSNQQIRIGDFGSGDIKDNISDETRQNNVSTLRITPRWSHPDHTECKLSSKFDFWSYGCIVFYIFAKMVPFKDITNNEIVSEEIKVLKTQGKFDFFFNYHEAYYQKEMNQFKEEYSYIYDQLKQFFLYYPINKNSLIIQQRVPQTEIKETPSISQEVREKIGQFLKDLDQLEICCEDKQQCQSLQYNLSLNQKSMFGEIDITLDQYKNQITSPK